MSAASPRLRSLRDRLRQVALFELGGLVLVTPPFVWLSGVPLLESLGLLALISLLAACWNATYNTACDWLEARLTDRTADRRPLAWRVAHAFGFEGGLLVMSLPLIMLWTGMGLLEALIADIGLALAYVAYAFVFNLSYDRVFPIDAGARETPAHAG